MISRRSIDRSGDTSAIRATSAAARFFLAGRQPDRDIILWALTLAILILPVASTAKFRVRSPLASLAGSVDSQIGAELALWAIGLFLVMALVGPLLLAFRVPRSAGARYAAALAALILLGTALAWPTTVAVLRGIQTLAVLAVISTIAPLSIDIVNDLLRRIGSILIWVSVAFLAITLVAPQFSVMGDVSYVGVRRLSLLAMHPIATANLLALTVVINIWVVVSSNYRLPTVTVWFRTIAAILAGLALLLTWSRGPVFGAAAALAIIAVTAARDSSSFRMRAGLRFGGLALGATAIISFGLIAAFFVRREGVDSLLTLNSRTDYLEAMFVVWRESPWFGFGHLSGRTALLDRFGMGESHGLFGEVLLSYGLVGVALVSAGLIGALVRVRRLYIRRSPFSSLFCALLIVLVSQAVLQDSFLGAPTLELTSLAILILVGWQRPLGRSGASGQLGEPGDPVPRTA